ncbi:MAG TPA: hypothetical protein PKC67_02540 [Kiritimatiellia bacterium]|nr:hypothetical protein [Kiritimatiellia bacterium]HMP33204.1 hypothetical protein [Kiritimatiellia bacterium]
MDNIQTNTRPGAIKLKAGENLVGYEGFLVKIKNVGGEARFVRPEAVADDGLFVLQEGATEGSYASAIPLHSASNFRVRLKGACNPGARLCLAGAGDYGKIRALPGDAGTYFIMAVAEEIGVDGQNVRIRPAMIGNVTV